MHSSSDLYSDIELSTEVMTASNHRLIQMLLDKCVQQIVLAKGYIEAKDIKHKHQSIAKARDIICYLRACLNFEDNQTREMSVMLGSLYDFMEKSLLQATLKNDTEYLDQAHEVIMNIKEGWDGIVNK